jgi:hypothetical protein
MIKLIPKFYRKRTRAVVGATIFLSKVAKRLCVCVPKVVTPKFCQTHPGLSSPQFFS